MTLPYSREERNDWVEDEEPMTLEEANESIRLALLDTPDSHPDAARLKGGAGE